MNLKDYLKEKFTKFLDKEVEEEKVGLFISKSVDELREVTGIVLIPEQADLHGDIYSEDEIRKAMISFNTLCMNTKLQHSVDSEAKVIESWQSKSDEVLNNKLVKKGTWLMTMKLPKDEWELVKKGSFTGFSIGCKASYEKLTEVNNG